MSLPTRLSTVVSRQAARQTLPAVRAPLAVQQQKRTRADASTSHAEFNSPFTRGTSGKKDTTVIPSFKKYRSGNETSNKVFQYFMVGAFGGLSALGAKNTVQGRSLRIAGYAIGEAGCEMAVG
jgi:ubiquinol-cytochrome c reductase iron-sulfur subunit